MEIVEAAPSDAGVIAELGRTIWNETYVDIIGQAQVDYMLREFQSEEAVAGQMADGYTYLLLIEGGETIGYVGYRPEDDRLFLSKLYILDRHRGRGFSRVVFSYLSDVARGLGRSGIRLTVNRDNARAIAVYTRCGFRTVRSQDTPIGGGFVMNDYVMELTV